MSLPISLVKRTGLGRRINQTENDANLQKLEDAANDVPNVVLQTIDEASTDETKGPALAANVMDALLLIDPEDRLSWFLAMFNTEVVEEEE